MPLSVTKPPAAWNHRKGSPSSTIPSAAPKTGNRLPKYPAVRIGVLLNLAADDPESQRRMTVFVAA
jgi:hypothetical protein